MSRSINALLSAHGYCDHTPVDTLMSAPCAMHLDVAEAMQDDGNYPDMSLAGFQIEPYYDAHA